MQTLHDVITGLTTESPTLIDKPTLLNKFANALGWNPSYHLVPSDEIDYVSIHLVVEHGLENTAILTFLKTPYYELKDEWRKRLLNISYNNLVDWHIYVDRDKITYVYNRISGTNNVVADFTFRREQYENLKSEAFDIIIGKKPNPNIPALDDALINTISYWKRAISSELDNEEINESLSTLFNSIIFVRAIEDNVKRYSKETVLLRILPWAWEKYKNDDEKGVEDIIKLALNELGTFDIPAYLINFTHLSKLKELSKQTISYLIGNFYDNKHTSLYQYDFSIISMHALSRIYEKYISILKVEENNYQLSLFPSYKNLAKEEINKAFGSVFTPQYIARFFAQYLKENLSPVEFKRIKVAEPSVGSGIFLRSILEIKCDPRQDNFSDKQIEDAFQDILGIDIDPNATKATELSLALLQLVLTGRFPNKLNIITGESINYISENSSLLNSFDAVISNPPFISTTGQMEGMRERVLSYLGEYASGRVDTYLAFLKLGIDLLKTGGYGLFVLPHSFMISSSAEKMRQYISDTCWIKCLADLSAIEVFGDTGIYVVLLIIQKKSEKHLLSPPVQVIKCRDFVGKALQAALNNYDEETPFYSVYNVDQSNFQIKQWFILPYKEIRLEKKLRRFNSLDQIVEIKQGFVSGDDAVFIVDKSFIPPKEKAIFIPYIQDRSINSYTFNKNIEKFLFYPFLDGKKLDEETMISLFPITWQYLLKNKDRLLGRKSFKGQGHVWWKPLRPRQPEEILQPKIITPHLTILPKFAFDTDGKFVVSHSPYIIPAKKDSLNDDILYYILAILNSTPCYWYISNHSHKYGRGYNMLEVKTLKDTPVPDPDKVPTSIMIKLISLVKERINSRSNILFKLDKEIDKIVSGLYGLTEEDEETLGIA